MIDPKSKPEEVFAELDFTAPKIPPFTLRIKHPTLGEVVKKHDYLDIILMLKQSGLLVYQFDADGRQIMDASGEPVVGMLQADGKDMAAQAQVEKELIDLGYIAFEIEKKDFSKENVLSIWKKFWEFVSHNADKLKAESGKTESKKNKRNS